MGGKSGSVTIGYKYFVGMHLVACHGPVDSVNRIIVGERDAYTTPITASGQIYINKPDLFGGEKKEGGVVGAVDVAFGINGQARNDYLQGHQDITAPAYLGVVGFVLRQVYLTALSPYIKPWLFDMTRHPKGWYEAKKAIGLDSNPAHIIRECLMNSEWGLALDAADIDDASFTAAADTLYAEGFGLSFVWYDQVKVMDFVNNVANHVSGVLFVHPTSGKFTFTLIRHDWVFAELLHMSPANVLAIESFDRPSGTDLANEVTIRWESRDGKPASMTAHDIGSLQSNAGQPNATTIDFPGIAEESVAAIIAQREIMRLARPLLRVTLSANRTAAALVIGGAFVLDWPDYGIQGLVMRVMQIDYGTPEDPGVRITATEDIFDNPALATVAPPSSGWINTFGTPIDLAYKYHAEATWWDIVHRITGESSTLITEYNTDGNVLVSSAVRPAGGMFSFLVKTRQGAAAFAEAGSGGFCPTATLSATLDKTTTSFVVANEDQLESVTPGTYGRITGGTAEELVSFVSFNPLTETLVVNRGVLDTVPQQHPSGARLWFSEGRDYVGASARYLEAEALDVKLLPVGSAAVLPEASASIGSHTFTARHLRPLAPGKLRVNTLTYPAALTGDLAITWAHRDRLAQTAYLVTQDELSIGPEAGTTYTVKIYNAQSGGTLIRTYSGITTTGQTYTTAQATTDNGGLLPANIRLEISAVRSGYESFQAQVVTATWAVV